MRYKNKKTGSVANVRDDKDMNTDWEPIGGKAVPQNDMSKWKNDDIDEYAANIGIDTKDMKKADKLAAIAAKEAGNEVA